MWRRLATRVTYATRQYSSAFFAIYSYIFIILQTWVRPPMYTRFITCAGQACSPVNTGVFSGSSGFPVTFQQISYPSWSYLILMAHTEQLLSVNWPIELVWQGGITNSQVAAATVAIFVAYTTMYPIYFLNSNTTLRPDCMNSLTYDRKMNSSDTLYDI